MMNIKTLLCYISSSCLAALVLAGCPAQVSEEEQQKIICERLVECGQLAKGRTAEECTKDLGEAYDQLHDDDFCRPLIERFQVAYVCVSEAMSCEDLQAGRGDEALPPNAGPCQKERKNAQEVFEEAAKKNPGKALACILPYAVALVGTEGSVDNK